MTIETSATEGLAFARSLRGSDVVVIQLRIGGFAGRLFDERFPQRYELCGDEGLGLGGLANAWRSWPAIARHLATIGQAAPDAVKLMLSSPVGILVRAAGELLGAERLYGICELPWTTLQRLCRVCQADASKCSFDYVGVNHIGWFYRIAHDTRDLVDDFMRRRSDPTAFPANALIRGCGAIPTPYTRLHYDPAAVLREQQSVEQPRATDLQTLQEEAFTAFRSGRQDSIVAVLSQRQATWYDAAVGPLILAMTGETHGQPVFLTMRNDGTVPGIGADRYLEIPHRVVGRRFEPMTALTAAPAVLMETLSQFTAFEETAVKALERRSLVSLRAAVAAHPWTGGRDAIQIAQEIWEQNRDATAL